MADPEKLPCGLCLRVVDQDYLIDVALPHDQIRAGASAKLCQDCCAAILETCVARHESAAPSATIEGAASDEPEPEVYNDREAS